MAGVYLDKRTGKFALVNFANRIDAERVCVVLTCSSSSLHLSSTWLSLHGPHSDPPLSSILMSITNYNVSYQAKSSSTKINDTTLTCLWHGPSASTPNNDVSTPGDGEETNPISDATDAHVDDVGLYDDVEDDTFGGDVFDEAAAAPDNEESVGYDYDDGEDVLVDYD